MKLRLLIVCILCFCIASCAIADMTEVVYPISDLAAFDFAQYVSTKTTSDDLAELAAIAESLILQNAQASDSNCSDDPNQSRSFINDQYRVVQIGMYRDGTPYVLFDFNEYLLFWSDEQVIYADCVLAYMQSSPAGTQNQQRIVWQDVNHTSYIRWQLWTQTGPGR